MVITNLQEKQNRKLWVPIRGGNRGGWSLFNWEDVRQMPYKDRQMYLGNSVTIGVLDKGGKWRKRDWYMKTDKKYKSEDLTCQQEEAIKRDYERMNAALGITQREDQEKLTEQEMRQLMKKIKMKKQEYEGPALPDAIGLGFDKAKVEIRAKPSVDMYNPHRLEAVDDLKLEQKSQTKEKEKKIKKDKKQKKKKDKQHKHRSRDDSAEKSEKKKKKEKHKKRSRQQKQERKRQKQEKRRKRRHSSSSSGSDSD